MLSWDEYDDNLEANSMPPPTAQKIEQLQIEEKEEALKIEVAKALDNQMVERSSIPEKPIPAVEAHERVSVDQKAMINCRADLNQLVPSKYDWAHVCSLQWASTSSSVCI